MTEIEHIGYGRTLAELYLRVARDFSNVELQSTRAANLWVNSLFHLDNVDSGGKVMSVILNDISELSPGIWGWEFYNYSLGLVLAKGSDTYTISDEIFFQSARYVLKNGVIVVGHPVKSIGEILPEVIEESQKETFDLLQRAATIYPSYPGDRADTKEHNAKKLDDLKKSRIEKGDSN